MSEAILDALIQLFALIIDIDEDNKISEREKEVIRSFLTRQLNRELSEKYMEVFEEYLLTFHKENYYLKSSDKKEKKTVTEKKILSICRKINEELQQAQKTFVLIQLIEFISLGDLVSEKEEDFLSTVSGAFGVPEQEYFNIFSFIVGTVHDIPEKKNVLVINNSSTCPYEEVKHRYDAKLAGELLFIRIETTKSYIVRYYGNEDIYLNSQNIVSGRTYSFEHGSSIRSLTINTIFFTDVDGAFSNVSPESQVCINAKDVTFWFRNTKNGIQKFNLSARSGSLVAFMGGSGVGKSTLINVLNGSLRPSWGEVIINGYDLNDREERDKLKGIIGLVPQNDLLIEDLTVYQNLYYSAKLCLNDLVEHEIVNVVNNVLEELGLSESRNLKVGSPLDKVISGGQRKRLNIALELIREPAVLFIDEPTSGLSSLDAENVMNLLKEQTDKGKLVIVNIHQPSSYIYKMFDEVLILDKGGYQIFYGNPMEAMVYFKRMSSHANPDEDQCTSCGTVNTDQLLHIIDAKVVDEHGKLTSTRKVSPEEWAGLFEKHINIEHPESEEKLNIPPSNFSIPGRVKQMWLFFKRDLVSKLANRQYVIISLLEGPLLALILGYFTKYIDISSSGQGSYVFYLNENLPAYLFMSVIVSLFFGLIGSSSEIIKDRRISKRESFLNLSRSSYLNSKITILFILSAIQTLSFVIIGNLILEIKDMTLSFWLILFSSSAFANLLGLNISSGFDKVITIYVLVPLLLIPQLLLSGVIVKFDKLHKSFTGFDNVPVIGDVMTSRWSFEALAVHQFKDNRYQMLIFESKQNESQNNWYYSFLIPELLKKKQECDFAAGKEEYSDHFIRNLETISYYIRHLESESGINSGGIGESLISSEYNEELAKQTGDYLQALRNTFRKEFLNAREETDSILLSLERKHGLTYLNDLKETYQNENLEIFVLNLRSKDRLIEFENRLIQKADPIYRIPTSRNGRAHFYAPVKRLGNRLIDTYWFNLGAIWILTLILYFILYLDLLRRLLNYLGRRS